MSNLFSNTGNVSFFLYGLFIAITIVAMVITIYQIKKGTIPTERLDKMIEVFKYAIVSTAIATSTLVVSDLFKEREQDVKELEYFDKYVQIAINVDNVQQRWQLAKYLSCVAPKGEMKTSWNGYYTEVDKDYEEYLAAKERTLRTDTSRVLTPQQFKDEVTVGTGESPIVSAEPNAEVQSDGFVVTLNSNNALAAQYERIGFLSLMQEEYEAAKRAFTQSENAKNHFHASYEIAKLLRDNIAIMLKDQNKKREVLSEIYLKYSAFAPAEVKQWLKAQAGR